MMNAAFATSISKGVILNRVGGEGPRVPGLVTLPKGSEIRQLAGGPSARFARLGMTVEGSAF